MPGIVVAQNFNNSTLPVGESLAGSILADAGLLHWFQADANHVTLIGTDIVSFNDKKSTTSKLTRASDITGATLVAGLFGSYAGAQFNLSESDRSIFSGDTLVLTSPYTWSGVATLRTLAASCTMCGTFTSATIRAILAVSISGANAGKLVFQYGTATAVGPTLELNKPFAFACGFDGVSIFIRMGGITYTAAAAGAPSTSPFALGALPGGSQFWDGNISDLIMCNVAVTATAGAAMLAKLTAFYKSVYGLTL
ncbi:hypothetical protein [Erwinia sp. JUb26]|uniref:hypothetical protein n=1 Tax=Erwinia sp. JUb26 TaxID=2485126 RepID=UPI000F46E466|nr:hypothetical protein [Erwinia sp. JUb26]ROR14963.1 hypothetical protein EC836_101463 [Erwinia sp. JUb26]